LLQQDQLRSQQDEELSDRVLQREGGVSLYLKPKQLLEDLEAVVTRHLDHHLATRVQAAAQNAVTPYEVAKEILGTVRKQSKGATHVLLLGRDMSVRADVRDAMKLLHNLDNRALTRILDEAAAHRTRVVIGAGAFSSPNAAKFRSSLEYLANHTRSMVRRDRGIIHIFPYLATLNAKLIALDRKLTAQLELPVVRRARNARTTHGYELAYYQREAIREVLPVVQQWIKDKFKHLVILPDGPHARALFYLKRFFGNKREY
jgi:hypothetical protein